MANANAEAHERELLRRAVRLVLSDNWGRPAADRQDGQADKAQRPEDAPRPGEGSGRS